MVLCCLEADPRWHHHSDTSAVRLDRDRRASNRLLPPHNKPLRTTGATAHRVNSLQHTVARVATATRAPSLPHFFKPAQVQFARCTLHAAACPPQQTQVRAHTGIHPHSTHRSGARGSWACMCRRGGNGCGCGSDAVCEVSSGPASVRGCSRLAGRPGPTHPDSPATLQRNHAAASATAPAARPARQPHARIQSTASGGTGGSAGV